MVIKTTYEELYIILSDLMSVHKGQNQTYITSTIPKTISNCFSKTEAKQKHY